MIVKALSSLGLLSIITVVDAAHQHSHGQHLHLHEKKDGQCQFPTDAGLVAVTPTEQNAGWAMSPNQPCLPGHYCPYACPPGQVSMQWDPEATSYTYPLSMVGRTGLFASFGSVGGREW